MLVPEDGGEPRSFRFSARHLRAIITLGALGVLLVLFMAMSWWFLALKTVQGVALQERVDSLEAERVQILALAQELDAVEVGYERIRSLFGTGISSVAPDLWLPPTGLPGTRPVGQADPLAEYVPNRWPLTESGFVTQPLVEGVGGENHPGLDIAIPTDSYVRASGAGRVLRVGEDPVYGHFLVLEHGNGYQSVYAHNSEVLVPRGREVRRGEVIALSGSSGRSTAPHLHFEILLDGLPVDPFSMVEQPG